MNTAQAIRLIVTDMKLGKLCDDGYLQFESKTLIYRHSKQAVSILAKDGRGEILRVTGDQVVICDLSPTDIKVCKKLAQWVETQEQLRTQKEIRPRFGLR